MSQPPASIPTIGIQEAATRQEPAAGEGALIVDVREADEFASVRLPAVAHLPMSTFAERFAELPKDRPLLIMCASGSRSAAASSFLLRNGWTDVSNVAGGIIEWERAGLPVRRGPVEPGEGSL